MRLIKCVTWLCSRHVDPLTSSLRSAVYDCWLLPRGRAERSRYAPAASHHTDLHVDPWQSVLNACCFENGYNWLLAICNSKNSVFTAEACCSTLQSAATKITLSFCNEFYWVTRNTFGNTGNSLVYYSSSLLLSCFHTLYFC